MGIMDKEKLTQFINKIENFDRVKHVQKIIVFGYYLTKISNEPYFDQKLIRQCYELLDDSPPANISDFLQKLKANKKLITVNGGYRLHRSVANELEISLKLVVSEDVSGNIEDKSKFSKDEEIIQKTKSEQSNVTQATSDIKQPILSETNSNKKYFDDAKAKEALTLIKGFDILQLPKFRVVGNYVRFDDNVRNKLKNMKQQIIEGLQPSAVGNENYLIWGPPGSGKTYFIQELAESLHDSIVYQELNLAKLDQDQFRASLTKLEKIEKPCICLVDEVDSGSSGEWAYETLLTYLFPSKPRRFRICFILAGSGGSSIGEMKKKIASQNKGTDLLNRILLTNEYVISPLGVGDNLIVGASQLIKTATKFYPEINAVEKLALFYIAVDPQFTTARQVGEFVVRSIRRIHKGEDRIKYDHLFDPGEPINKEFYQQAKLLDVSLVNSYILVFDDRINSEPRKSVVVESLLIDKEINERIRNIQVLQEILNNTESIHEKMVYLRALAINKELLITQFKNIIDIKNQLAEKTKGIVMNPLVIMENDLKNEIIHSMDLCRYKPAWEPLAPGLKMMRQKKMLENGWSRDSPDFAVDSRLVDNSTDVAIIATTNLLNKLKLLLKN